MEENMCDIQQRHKDYDKDHCWQYDRKLATIEDDLSNLKDKSIPEKGMDEYDFDYVDKTDKDGCEKIKEFIKRYEWLGKMPNRPTHRFTASIQGHLAGVVVMATPNSFCHLIGKENKHREKLVSRGASISWAPKNIGSWLLSRSVKWMAKNTDFCLFTAYSDPEAKELGTIYQALNWMYLGQTSGTQKQYFDPRKPHLGWFSDREFRKKSKYKQYAANLNIANWDSYMKKYSPNWDIVPPEMKKAIKEEEKKYRDSCQVRTTPAKHKYAYVLCKDRRDTKKFRKMIKHYPYPKTRGE